MMGPSQLNMRAVLLALQSAPELAVVVDTERRTVLAATTTMRKALDDPRAAGVMPDFWSDVANAAKRFSESSAALVIRQPLPGLSGRRTWQAEIRWLAGSAASPILLIRDAMQHATARQPGVTFVGDIDAGSAGPVPATAATTANDAGPHRFETGMAPSAAQADPPRDPSAPLLPGVSEPSATDRATLADIARRIRASAGPADDQPVDGRQSEVSPNDGRALSGEPGVAMPITAPLALVVERAGDPDTGPTTASAARPAASSASCGAADPQLAARILAHELRTPMAAIAAAAEAMRDEQLGPIGSHRYRDYAAEIATNAHHALELIARMRVNAEELASDPVRIGAAAIDFSMPHPRQPELLQTAQITGETVASARRLAANRRILVDLRCEADTPPIRADATAVRQMLFNLLSNALKFTPAGGRICVSCQCDASGGARLEVRDNGKGMTRDDVTRALSGNSVSPSRSGSGFGLAIVQSLANRNGCRLAIDSAPGKGTRVTIVFPMAAAADGSAANRKPSATGA